MVRAVVDRAELASIVGWAVRAVPSRPTMPILAGIKLTVTDNMITASAFDNSQSAVASASCSSDEPMTVVVSGRLLHDLTKALAGKDATLSIDGNRLVLSSGRSTFHMPQMPAEDYPSIPVVPPCVGQMNADDFSDLVHKVAVAAGKDDSLPTLTGVFLTFDPAAQKVTAASTDRYRLAVTSTLYVPEVGASEVSSALVPAKVLDGYAKSLTDSDAVSVHYGDGLFGVTAGSRSAATRLLGGEFPKYEKLLPTEFSAEVTVAVADLSSAIRRVALVADRNSAVQFCFTDGQVDITVVGSTDSTAAEAVDVDYSGDEFKMAFNPVYFVEGLGSLGADEVRIQLTEPNRPALIVPNDGSTSSKYLLMPVRSKS